MRGTGGWFELDLEHRRGTVSSSHPDSQPTPCQRRFAPNRPIDLWSHQRGSQTLSTARCTELDDGNLQAIISALGPHIGARNEATTCATYIIRNRRRLRYPKFQAQVCVLPPASWRPDAKWRSARAWNAPACTGASPVPMPSSLFAVPSSVALRGFLGAPHTAASGCGLTVRHKSKLHPAERQAKFGESTAWGVVALRYNNFRVAFPVCARSSAG